MTSPARLSSLTISLRICLDLGEVGAAVRKDPLRSLRVTEDGGERQAKLVRKRARKFAQRENARQVRHFVTVTRRLLVRPACA